MYVILLNVVLTFRSQCICQAGLGGFELASVYFNSSIAFDLMITSLSFKTVLKRYSSFLSGFIHKLWLYISFDCVLLLNIPYNIELILTPFARPCLLSKSVLIISSIPVNLLRLSFNTFLHGLVKYARIYYRTITKNSANQPTHYILTQLVTKVFFSLIFYLNF